MYRHERVYSMCVRDVEKQRGAFIETEKRRKEERKKGPLALLRVRTYGGTHENTEACESSV